MKKSILSLFSILSFFFIVPTAVQAQEWLTDLAFAQQQAYEKNENIVLVFQGSDWCAPCIKLDKEIWSSEEFKTYAKDHFILLKADFPRKKENKLTPEQQEKNNQLAEHYNKEGVFPKVVVLNAEGKILGATGYKHISPSEYIQVLNSFN